MRDLRSRTAYLGVLKELQKPMQGRRRKMKIFGGCFLKKHEWQFFLLPALGADRHGNRITIGFIWLVFSIYIRIDAGKKGGQG